MPYDNLPDRSYETTKLLRRCQGVFSKARRTLTSPPQFRSALLSGPEGCSTTALPEKRTPEEQTVCDYQSGAVTSTHNCTCRNFDDGNAFALIGKPSPSFFEGKLSCKRDHSNKRFLPGCSNFAGPIYRYNSDRRPRGLSLQQLDVALHHRPVRRTITLFRILNGPAGYRTDSEDSIKSPGRYCRIRTEKVQNSMRQRCHDSRYMFGTEVYQYGIVL
jgi:hypothetical protein